MLLVLLPAATRIAPPPATKWIHVAPFGVQHAPATQTSGDCVDLNEHCKEWSVFSQCEKNPGTIRRPAWGVGRQACACAAGGYTHLL